MPGTGGGPSPGAYKDGSSSGITIVAEPGPPHWGGGADLEEQFVTPFLDKNYGIRYGSGKRTPAENAAVGGAANSDHLTTNTTSSAADYPTTDGGEAANALGRAMGRSSESVGTYDRFEAVVDGVAFSVQILWAVEGHYDHIHVGIQYVGKTNKPDTIDGSVTGGTAGGGTGGSGGAASPEAIAKSAAISTYLEFPALMVSTESIALSGDRSLMNDQQLLPFIEQLCQGSLRNFQSMPNGSFYAFFPDYFGGLNHRTPYWEISDIEIVSGHIDLSDDALATHVFVVGDTAIWDGQIDIMDKIRSAGVVSVFTAFLADFLNGVSSPALQDMASGKGEGGKKKAKQTQKEYEKELKGIPSLASKDRAISFLKKYGARPYFEEAPMVRTPFFEKFLAYQKFCLLWSRQFLTTFEFTFMPELFPGGLVAFPNHGIQCYVDEVTHECDYQGGFTTRANLSAPAAIKDRNGKRRGPKKYIHEGMIRGNLFKDAAESDKGS